MNNSKSIRVLTKVFMAIFAVPVTIASIIYTAWEDSNYGFMSGLGIRNYACFIIFWMILFMPLILKLF